MYLLFDIGGTKTRFAVSSDGKKLAGVRIFDTPPKFNEGVTLFKKVAGELMGGRKIRAISGGIGGALYKGRLINSLKPNLRDWNSKPFKEKVEKEFRVPVFIENDAALGGLGEAIYGAGRGKRIVVYITIGTGVGGVRIVNGRVDENRMGFEPGHQIIDIGGLNCFSCKGQGHLESYISGSSLERRLNKKFYEIKDPKVWEEVARYLAYGLYNTIVFWSPDILILGGSMVIKVKGIPVERVRFHLKKILTIFREIPPVEISALGDLAGLYGAVVLAKQNLGS